MTDAANHSAFVSFLPGQFSDPALWIFSRAVALHPLISIVTLPLRPLDWRGAIHMSQEPSATHTSE